ncbi:restriction endonuclease subunit S [Lutispora thermophila]|uniref:Type I restriction enzyme, S subunit n=1 Tax=Lutispora thermophila DSM 19022 TaxID=1122184 RepID=A0A1M6HDF3_9FIRM|nr:restriction endonuclease subunit S [Lutispora thermophila]SHJ20225.1 type I restriction enzyme, S subunit [Lutispora thermophila DSM 19022]
MNKVKDYFTLIRNGASIKQNNNKIGYPITRIETISDGYVDREKMGYAGIKDLSKYEDYILESGDILMSHINSVKHLGKTALYEKINDEKVIHGMNLLVLRPNKKLITSKYAYYYFRTPHFKRQLPNITKNSVNQSSFTVTALKELYMYVPSIEKQNKIVEILDKAQLLIIKRKQQIEACDELVKSQFVEMFGDPVTNEYKWKVKKLNEVCTKITDGTHGTPPRYPEGYLLITGKNIRSTGIDLNDVEFVSEEDHKIIYARCNPEYEDVLYTNIGVNYGIAAINTLDFEFSMKNVALLKPCKSVLNPYYLWQVLNLLRNGILEQNKCGGAQTFMALSAIKNISIPMPDLQKQNQFAAFVQQVNKLKSSLQQSLTELETNFNALMQKAFNEELFL